MGLYWPSEIRAESDWYVETAGTVAAMAADRWFGQVTFSNRTGFAGHVVAFAVNSRELGWAL
jgi:hypothetical protein